ncbi:MarR family transcriptional regulator (plasmid) [Bacillus mycoides]|nr:MarR family transcriptional regulator [Bacillus mycoides]
MQKKYIEQIEHEVVRLLRRADLKKLLDRETRSMDRSAYLVMKKLESEGPLPISVIAHAFGVNVSTISRQMQNLKSNGWVTSFSDKKDARVSLVNLTKQGLDILTATKIKRVETYSDLLSDWTEEDIQTFTTLLSKLNISIEQKNNPK